MARSQHSVTSAGRGLWFSHQPSNEATAGLSQALASAGWTHAELLTSLSHKCLAHQGCSVHSEPTHPQQLAWKETALHDLKSGTHITTGLTRVTAAFQTRDIMHTTWVGRMGTTAPRLQGQQVPQARGTHPLPRSECPTLKRQPVCWGLRGRAQMQASARGRPDG